MRLDVESFALDSNIDQTKSIGFKMVQNGHMFRILSDGIYSNKIAAVIRELSCNAYDAHVAAGKKGTPFKVFLPGILDPRFYVEDEGTGIPPEKIGDIFWTYGQSSKGDDNEQIGALGLGSKSPFAYTKGSFIVKNRYQGIEHIYFCMIGDEGYPTGNEVSALPTDQPSGVTVEFAVEPRDISAFHDNYKRIFRFWDVQPIQVGAKVEVTKPTRLIEGNGWYLEPTSSYNKATALQGNVPYPIDQYSITGLPHELSYLTSRPFVIKFEMGELAFAASREVLSYTKQTIVNVIERLTEIHGEVRGAVRASLFKRGMSQLSYRQYFQKRVRELAEALGWNTNQVLAAADLKVDGTVTYEGTTFKIHELMNGNASFYVTGTPNIALHRFARNGRRKPTLYSQSSVLITAARDFTAEEYEVIYGVKNATKAGTQLLSKEWFDITPPKRFTKPNADLSKADHVVRLQLAVAKEPESFTLAYKGDLNVSNTPVFVLDDLEDADSGAIFRELFNRFAISESHVLVTVRDLATADAELKRLIDAAMINGANIEKLSKYGDPRPEHVRARSTRKFSIPVVRVERSHETSSQYYYGAEVSYRNTFVTNAEREAVSVEALLKLPAVPCVVRSGVDGVYYAKSMDTTRSVITGSLLAHYAEIGAFDGLFTSTVDQDEFKVYCLTDTQYKSYLAKGMKLVNLNDRVTDAVKRVATVELMTKVLSYNVMASELNGQLAAMYGDLDKIKAGAPNTMIVQLLEELDVLMSTKPTAREALAAVVGVKRGINVPTIALNFMTELRAKIYALYPMLALTTYRTDRRSVMFDYFKLVDAAAAVAKAKLAEETVEV